MTVTVEDIRRRAAEIGTARPRYRKGQAVFHALEELHPRLASEVYATPNDPSSTDKRLPTFWAYVAARLSPTTAR